jgi:hypothetical protein
MASYRPRCGGTDMSIASRRRALMAAGKKENWIPLWQGVTVQKSINRGTITVDNSTITAQSTASPNWSFYVAGQGNVSLFPTYQFLNGKKVKFKFDVAECTLTGSEAPIMSLSFIPGNSNISGSANRLKWKQYSTAVGHHEDIFIVDLSKFTNGTGTVTNSSVLDWKCFFYMASGSTITLKDISLEYLEE